MTKNRRAQAIHDSCAELCQAKLLTRAEEYELGTKIQTLMGHVGARQELAAGLGRAPTFSEWAESRRMTVVELEESLKVGGAAKKTMVEANMRMVISIARKYQHLGVPLTDLIQEGSLGLVRAVEKFDPERGFKLSTYSAWWIQQAIFKVRAGRREAKVPAADRGDGAHVAELRATRGGHGYEEAACPGAAATPPRLQQLLLPLRLDRNVLGGAVGRRRGRLLFEPKSESWPRRAAGETRSFGSP
ncbi:RNA polymerase, sigma 70 subunit, RpoD subfamily [Ectocarpus siliculosus]|uniref:RNA polymerase, sigma 70 subunit, RpoD subfamily n=1 Tax=Ectocarpus siliculosus TaxID=2880 RepID=D8LGM6_ECTSI|nr:RNA polymerase, sigma 70 subunit, RpoD subfamily [Ectocarpus siliculosus]|eukprot:CBN75768.1 RNA polymerase, sigma 70 subunit, RpoD subfamily [Ectocarpus siliculosus]